jgi:thymidylate synthase ThyX
MLAPSQDELFTKPIQVRLLNAFQEPYNSSIAAARTCYSKKLVKPEDMAATPAATQLRDRIADSTFFAGHHTIWQHVHFQFSIENITRQCLWSFLHAHSFYNSEQVSQRYVPVHPEALHIPNITPSAQRLYQRCAEAQMRCYEQLIEELLPDVAKAYFAIFPARRKQSLAEQNKTLRKKAQEIARSILPLATHAHLHHTINAITLFRYAKLCRAYDVGEETHNVVAKMLAAVQQLDPLFLRHIEDPMPLEDTLEYQALQAWQTQPHAADDIHHTLTAFDDQLQGNSVRLVDYSPGAPQLLADSIRLTLGLPAHRLSNEDAIAWALHPQKNSYLRGPLDLATHSKIMRSLHLVHYTFQKKLSHAADSQNQRHRLTPGARPVLYRHYRHNVHDVVVPPLIQNNPAAHERFHTQVQEIWRTINHLLADHIPHEQALYLLPNAFSIRFYETGSLIGFHHKWSSRLCYNAQEEIWHTTQQEVLAVQHVHPEIGRWLLPPCTLRLHSGTRPICPEGNRYCGVPVWKYTVQDYRRSL